jgi:hypothetical protein
MFQSDADGIRFAETPAATCPNYTALCGSALCSAKEEKSPLPLKHLT